MDRNSLTLGKCIDMLEKEKTHVVIHAGKVTDIIEACNNVTQRNTRFHCVTPEKQAPLV